MEKLLTVREAAEILGIKEETLHLWASQRRIPHYRLGRKAIRFKEAELTAWLEARRIEASPAFSRPQDARAAHQSHTRKIVALCEDRKCRPSRNTWKV